MHEKRAEPPQQDAYTPIMLAIIAAVPYTQAKYRGEAATLGGLPVDCVRVGEFPTLNHCRRCKLRKVHDRLKESRYQSW